MKIILILLLFISVGCNKQNIEENSNNEINSQDKVENNNQDKIDSENNDDNIQNNENKIQPINIYLFWGDGCHACANLKEFFNSLDEKYNKYFNLVKYEVWYNEDNYELMLKVGNYLNQTRYAVPFLVIGDEVIIGFSEAKSEYILDKIIEEYNNDRIDIMDEIQ